MYRREKNKRNVFLSSDFLPFREVMSESPSYYILVMVAPCATVIYTSTIAFTFEALSCVVLIKALSEPIATMESAVMPRVSRCTRTASLITLTKVSLDVLASFYWIKIVSGRSVGVSILLVTNPFPIALIEVGLISPYSFHC